MDYKMNGHQIWGRSAKSRLHHMPDQYGLDAYLITNSQS